LISSISFLLFFLSKIELLKKTIAASVLLTVVLLLQVFELQTFLQDGGVLLSSKGVLIPLATMFFGASCIYFKKPLYVLALPLVLTSVSLKFLEIFDPILFMFVYWLLLIKPKNDKGIIEPLKYYLLPVLIFAIRLVLSNVVMNTNSLESYPIFTNAIDAKYLLASLIFVVTIFFILEALENLGAFLKRGSHSHLVKLLPVGIIILNLKKELSFTNYSYDLAIIISAVSFVILSIDSKSEKFIKVTMLSILSFFPEQFLWVVSCFLVLHPIWLSFIENAKSFKHYLPTLILIFATFAFTYLAFTELSVFGNLLAVIWVLTLLNISGNSSLLEKEASV
jgi:hypothetical protein